MGLDVSRTTASWVLKIRCNDFNPYYYMTVVVELSRNWGNGTRNGFYTKILTNGGCAYIPAEFRSVLDGSSC